MPNLASSSDDDFLPTQPICRSPARPAPRKRPASNPPPPPAPPLRRRRDLDALISDAHSGPAAQLFGLFEVEDLEDDDDPGGAAVAGGAPQQAFEGCAAGAGAEGGGVGAAPRNADRNAGWEADAVVYVEEGDSRECPVCGKALGNVDERSMQEHVNDCLDGNAPVAPQPTRADQVSAWARIFSSTRAGTPAKLKPGNKRTAAKPVFKSSDSKPKPQVRNGITPIPSVPAPAPPLGPPIPPTWLAPPAPKVVEGTAKGKGAAKGKKAAGGDGARGDPDPSAGPRNGATKGKGGGGMWGKKKRDCPWYKR
ncbi:hypothetical protein BDK51DRAFT_37859, partial [Blyttiomyces helicus]